MAKSSTVTHARNIVGTVWTKFATKINAVGLKRTVNSILNIIAVIKLSTENNTANKCTIIVNAKT